MPMFQQLIIDETIHCYKLKHDTIPKEKNFFFIFIGLE